MSSTLLADSVVAVVNGKPITDADIEKRVLSQLTPLRQKEYDIKADAAKEIAIERLQAAEAARRGITVEELMKREIDAKVAQPSEDEIKLMMRVLATKLPASPDEARKVVIESLRAQKIDDRRTEFNNELLDHSDFEVKLTVPRAKIALAPADPVRGAAAAPVTIVEFSDFQCPYCQRSQEQLREVQKQYGEKVRIVFKQFPLEDMHEHARFAAEASLCANDQKKFWALHDWMFNNVQKLNQDAVVAAAPSLGMDAAALSKCIETHQHAKDVDADIALGNDLGVGGTPTFFINGRMMQASAFSDFKSVIDQELRPAKR
jgi:protein-disulfide isomerase